MTEYTRPATWEDVKTLARHLEEECVEYALVGGYALAAHGFNRFTEDIDILVNPAAENSERWILALSRLPDGAAKELAAESDVFADDQRYAIRINDEFTVDVMPSIAGLSWDDMKQHVVPTKIDDTTVRVLDLRGLLKTKQGSRPKAGMPFWSQLAMAQDEVLVPFTDVPEGFAASPVVPGAVHFLDTRLIDTFYTPNDDFYLVQHYNQPEIDKASYKLRVTGLVDKPFEISYADLVSRPKVEIDAGFECGGNGERVFQGLIGNARWGGVRLRDLLNEAGARPAGIEVVLYGADKGTENVRNTNVEVAFGRSMHIDDAMRPEVLVAYEMNGEPLNLYHGAPVRIVVPGWYGVSNVKWLEQIHLQDSRYMGRFMARDYVTLSRREIGGVERWEERSVTKMQLKSSIIRVTRRGTAHTIMGFVLNDGTPLRAVEVKIDDGPWRAAEVDPQSSQYSWKIFRYAWTNATPGEHRIVSRVIDANGQVQATPEQMPEKPTRWENYAQFMRTLVI